MTAQTRQIERAGRAARYFRSLGWNPLPSCPVKGRPMMRSFSHERDHGLPEACLDKWWGPCVQVPTGSIWGLVVVDLDGPMAREVWGDLCRFRPLPDTWSADTPRGGRHLWFALPEGTASCPWRIAWCLRDTPDEAGRTRHVKHELIEILGDGRLAMAPPSYRVRDGVATPYRWAVGPRDLPRPAEAPAWVLALGPASGGMGPGNVSTPVAARAPGPALLPRGGGYRFDEVLAAIGPAERLSLVRSWGLRVASDTPNAAGWHLCRAVDRDDSNPSAGFKPATGMYAETGRSRLGLFDLSVVLGVHSSTVEARDALGLIYVGRRPRRIA